MGEAWTHGRSPGGKTPAGIDTSVAHSARVYDYILGGKDNFEVDRKAAAAATAAQPHLATAMRENRAVMRRIVAFLAGEAGIRQFLDIGTGLPTSPNVHEIAGAAHPGARVVYVDNDPIVLAHARALLTGGGGEAIAYIDADARDPGRILGAPELRATLDLSEPVALLLFGILHFIPDEDDPYGMVATLLASLPAGSYLAIQHPTRDFYEPGQGAAAAYSNAGIPFRYRTRAEFSRFLDGLDLVPPGIRPMAEWRPEDSPATRLSPVQAGAYAAVARKVHPPVPDEGHRG